MNINMRTICCRMAPTPILAASLSATCKTFAAACNAALMIALENGVSNNIRLHRLTYAMLRDRFSLSANLTVRAIRRVSAAMTAAKRRGKKPRIFRPTSIDYDARIFAYREQDESVSLSVCGGHIHVPLALGDYQRSILAVNKLTGSATVVHKGTHWDIHVVVRGSDAEFVGGPPIGIDLGIRNIAATSKGTLYDGGSRQRFKETRMRIRASLQSKGTRGTRCALHRLSGYERRYIRHENHVLSKQIVDEALKAHCGIIRMERLVDIRQHTKTRNKHLNRMVAGWSFYQLQTFVAYKAKRMGLAIEYVKACHTSQICSLCGQMGVRNQDTFQCATCGDFHADVNAARNIAGGAVVNRPKLTACVKHS